MNNNKIIGTLAITINMISIFYKGLNGARAGWEVMLPIVLIGIALTIISAFAQRNTITCLAIATGIVSAGLYLLEQFILFDLFN